MLNHLTHLTNIGCQFGNIYVRVPGFHGLELIIRNMALALKDREMLWRNDFVLAK